MEQRTKSRPNWYFRIATIALLVVGALALAHVLWLEHLRGQVDAHLDAWRARGLPATLAELDAWYERKPPAPNAADAYDAAFAQYVGDKNLSVSTNLDEVCAHVTSNSTMLALLHEAAEIEEYYRPLDFSQGMHMLLPHLGGAMKAVRLLVAESRCSMREGRYGTVENNISLALKMSRDFSSEPVLISHLVGLSYVDLSSAIVRHALEEGAPGSDHMLAWTDLLRPYADPGSMVTGILSNWPVMNHVFLHDPVHYVFGSTHDVSIRIGVGAYDISGLLLLDQLACLEIEMAVYDTFSQPYTEWPAAKKTIDTRIDNVPRSRILTHILMPSTSVITLPIRTSANIRLAIAALAVERYRLEHGALPPSLDLLMPDYLDNMPEDPFTGTDLIYLIEEAGYVVYSVGEDGIDNGGLDRKQVSRASEWDIVFRVDKGER